MIKKMKNLIFDEMNKTVLPDDTGVFVGICNNYKVVEDMSFLSLIKHSFRVLKRRKG